MLDQAKSSPNPRRLPTEGTLAPSPQQPEADSAPLPDPASQTAKPDDSLYSIRVAENPGTLCAACGKQETGAGPVGYLDDAAVCDLCLLQGSHQLGLVLAVVAVTRAYASVRGDSEESQAALEELGAFARVYDRVASKSGPARMFKIIPDFSRGNDTTN